VKYKEAGITAIPTAIAPIAAVKDLFSILFIFLSLFLPA
jgi:hypothetical protein